MKHYSPDFQKKVVELILNKKITSIKLNKILKYLLSING